MNALQGTAYESVAKSPPVAVVESDGRRRKLGGKVTIGLGRGDLFKHTVAGAGGHGDPFERDPAMVAWDALEGYISLQAARDQYGVALKGDFSVDEAQTAWLRQRTKAQSPSTATSTA